LFIYLISRDEKFYTYTLEAIKNLFPFIDWHDILSNNIPKGRNISDIRIQMYNIEYFNELNFYSSVNDPSRVINTDAIVNYIVLHKLYQDAPRLDPEVRKIVPDSPFQTRSSLCIDKVLENLGLLAGRFYSMIASHGESDRLKLEAIADNIKKSLGNRIEHADWLDDSTRASAMKKVTIL
jgi:predicted metalloendopeptidase